MQITFPKFFFLATKIQCIQTVILIIISFILKTKNQNIQIKFSENLRGDNFYENVFADFPNLIKKHGKESSLHYVKSVYIRSFFWSIFFRIRTEYGDLLCKPPYSVRMQKNKDQKNSECGHLLRSVNLQHK